MKKLFPLLCVTGVLLSMLILSEPAVAGARRGLSVCAATLAPALFPFYVLAELLSALGMTDLLSGVFGRAAGRLFRVSGAGAQAFFLGLCGGYPLGASVTARLRRDRLISREEGERLLAFCNNSGPAFILGAAGGVFRSPAAGALLYASHILGAVCVGLLLRGRGPAPAGRVPVPAEPQRFTEAFPKAVSAALTSTLTVCGYVTLFSALIGMLTPLQGLSPLPRALTAGFLELGSGTAALAGLPPTPLNLAGAALILGWGGLSVHCQVLSTVADTDIKCARHLMGRALCGVIAALFTCGLAQLFFRQ